MRRGAWGARPLAASLAALALAAASSGCEALGQGRTPTIEADALQAQASDPDVRRLYELSGWRPIWTEARAEALEAALEGAVRHGLDDRRLRAGLEASAGSEREVSLSRAALAYAKALAAGVVDPEELHGIFTLDRNRVDVVAGLHGALQADGLGAWLDSLAPQDAEYRALSEAFVQARRSMDQGARTSIADGPLIRPGGRDGRVPALSRRLVEAGVLDAPVEGTRYDTALAEAVRDFQRRNGLAVDGVVGPNTLRVLNEGPAERARRLAVNLERRRWLARTPPPTRIDVNIAAAEMRYVRDGETALRSRVVAGTAANKTPLLQETFERLVLNPPWYVPQSIAGSEILPRGRGYLERNDMYVEDGRVIQRPGPNAALGRVKFDMQNPYAIYLHDTPAKALFGSDDRHRSHGCVRVQDAVAFARRLARERGAGEAFEAALGSGATRVVSLGEPVSVRLLYHTAFLDEDRQVSLAEDVYGWDEDLSEALGLGRGARRERPAVAALLGP